MNKNRILILADLLEMLDHPQSKPKCGFNMNNFRSTYDYDMSEHSCGTTACIGGWAVLAFDEDPEKYVDATEPWGPKAQALLGLNEKTADNLFYNFTTFKGEITPKRAVKVLRHLAKTNKVNWNVR